MITQKALIGLSLTVSLLICGAVSAQQTASSVADERFFDLTGDLTRGDIAKYELQKFGPVPERGVIRRFKFPQDANDGVYGIDVSHHNGPVDWRSVRAAGVKFVYVKASQGERFRDRRFPENWQGVGRQVEIRRGAYHFLSGKAAGGQLPSGTRQAENYVAYIKSNGGMRADDLAPVLDLEWDRGVAGCGEVDCWASKSPDQIIKVVKDWISVVERDLRRKPVIYTAQSWWRERLGSRRDLESYLHWTADYRASSINRGAPIKVDGHQSVAWQFTDNARVAGVGGRLDANKLTAEELQALSGEQILAER